jgi:hypothetical protein
MKTNLKTLTDYCKDFIIDNLPDYLGTSVYGCDLGCTITEGINADGSCTYSTYEAKEYLKFWWDDAADYFQYEKDNFGENLYNPFKNPEAYMVCMVIEGVNSLLSQSSFIDKNWNNEIELTKKNIKKIIQEIKDFQVEF